jgi:hypothetical protein
VLAGGLGFEPRQSESESEGLPLADPPSGISAILIAPPNRACKPLGSELLDQAGEAGLGVAGTFCLGWCRTAAKACGRGSGLSGLRLLDEALRLRATHITP